MSLKLLSFLAVLALSFSFVVAMSEDAIQTDTPTNTQVDASIQQLEKMIITLVSPANGQIFEFPANADIFALEVKFQFLVEPMQPDVSCTLNVAGNSDRVFDVELTDSGNGVASSQFGVGQYDWVIECVKKGYTFTSETYSFEVKAFTEPQIPSNNNNPTNTNVNGGSSNDDDDSGRRLTPISLPLEELSNTAEGSDDQESSPGITGAVIGALGKKGLTGIIILAVIIGIAGLVIYNRRKLGVVKAN